MSLESAVSFVGTITGGFLLASPLLSAKRFYGARDVGSMPPTYFMLQFLNCVGWVVYGQLIQSLAVLCCNAFGVVVATVACVAYWMTVRAMEADGRKSQIISTAALRLRLLAVFGIAALFCVAVIALASSSNPSAAKTFSGLVSALCSAIMLASPLESVKVILKTKNADMLSPTTISCAVVNAAIWTLFGFLRMDPFIYLPNAAGFVSSVALAVLLLRFGARSNGASSKGFRNGVAAVFGNAAPVLHPMPALTPAVTPDASTQLTTVEQNPLSDAAASPSTPETRVAPHSPPSLVPIMPDANGIADDTPVPLIRVSFAGSGRGASFAEAAAASIRNSLAPAADQSSTVSKRD